MTACDTIARARVVHGWAVRLMHHGVRRRVVRLIHHGGRRRAIRLMHHGVRGRLDFAASPMPTRLLP